MDDNEITVVNPHINEFYTFREEMANTITHGIGAGLSLAGLTVLILLASLQDDAWRIASVMIYGCTLVILYFVSTLYHIFQSPRVKYVFRIMDHAAIYLFIAGTYTPFAWVIIHNRQGWLLFGSIWSLALVGIVFKIFWVGRFETFSISFYVLMVWLCVFALGEGLTVLSWGGSAWFFSGGVIYMTGIIFYSWERLPYNHAVWHMFVLAGSICHYVAILFYVLPAR